MVKNNNKITPLISVVMPVYNAEKHLHEAIESILCQTYTNFEFIIINDGSTDSSLQIIQSFDDRRIRLVDRGNKGLIESLNEGICLSKGEYIARMDADDISLSQRFERQIELMTSRGVDICGCHYYVIGANGRYTDTFIAPLTEQSFFIYLCVTAPFAHPSVMIKKQFISHNDLSYGRGAYKNAEDYALWVAFWVKEACFDNVDEFLFKYRRIPGSLSKRNRSGLDADKRKISKEFIISNKGKLIESILNSNIECQPKYERELMVVACFILIKYDFSIKYFSLIKKINARAVICGFLKFLKERY